MRTDTGRDYLMISNNFYQESSSIHWASADDSAWIRL